MPKGSRRPDLHSIVADHPVRWGRITPFAAAGRRHSVSAILHTLDREPGEHNLRPTPIDVREILISEMVDESPPPFLQQTLISLENFEVLGEQKEHGPISKLLKDLAWSVLQSVGPKKSHVIGSEQEAPSRRW